MVEITGKLISWTSHRSAQRIFTKYAPLFKRDVGWVAGQAGERPSENSIYAADKTEGC